MNRVRGNPRKSVLRVTGLVVLFSLLSLSFADVVQAGDTDGITGYSIRLKHKEFEGSDAGSSGSQSAGGFELETSDLPTTPQVYRVTEPLRLRMIVFLKSCLLFRAQLR